MAAGKLDWIARDMRAEVIRHGGPARRELRGGLSLALQAVEPGRWELTLSRPATMPSDVELAVVRQAFGAPLSGTMVTEDPDANEVTILWRP